jgi:hypothetical protein
MGGSVYRMRLAFGGCRGRALAREVPGRIRSCAIHSSLAISTAVTRSCSTCWRRRAIGAEDLVVSVGDLVDRGPEPGEVVDWFRARENSVVICGNHERKHVRGVLSYSQQITKLQIGARYEEQVRWMAGLPYHWEREDVRVVHWGMFPGVPLAEVPEDVRAGTASGDARLKERFGEGPWYEHYQDDVPVVFGHAVVGTGAAGDPRSYLWHRYRGLPRDAADGALVAGDEAGVGAGAQRSLGHGAQCLAGAGAADVAVGGDDV